jgi:hypothetical protein
VYWQADMTTVTRVPDQDRPKLFASINASAATLTVPTGLAID